MHGCLQLIKIHIPTHTCRVWSVSTLKMVHRVKNWSLLPMFIPLHTFLNRYALVAYYTSLLSHCFKFWQDIVKPKYPLGWIEVVMVNVKQTSINKVKLRNWKSCVIFTIQDRLLKPLGGFAGLTGEWRDLAAVISRVCCKAGNSQLSMIRFF